MFDSVDLQNFWNDNDYALKEYVSEYPTDEVIRQTEAELGYKLPESYIYLMKLHNGGMPKKFCYDCGGSFPAMIVGIYGIGRDKLCSLCGEFGTGFWVEEWGYPDVGVAICDTPSAGHDMVFLDYSQCGRDGEPHVVLIDQELDYKVHLADNFEEFISNLRTEEEIGLE